MFEKLMKLMGVSSQTEVEPEEWICITMTCGSRTKRKTYCDSYGYCDYLSTECC